MPTPFPEFHSRAADRMRFVNNDIAMSELADLASVLVELHQSRGNCRIFIAVGKNNFDNNLGIDLKSPFESVHIQEFIHEFACITMGIKHKIGAEQEEYMRKWPELAELGGSRQRERLARRAKKQAARGGKGAIRRFFGTFRKKT